MTKRLKWRFLHGRMDHKNLENANNESIITMDDEFRVLRKKLYFRLLYIILKHI